MLRGCVSKKFKLGVNETLLKTWNRWPLRPAQTSRSVPVQQDGIGGLRSEAGTQNRGCQQTTSASTVRAGPGRGEAGSRLGGVAAAQSGYVGGTAISATLGDGKILHVRQEGPLRPGSDVIYGHGPPRRRGIGADQRIGRGPSGGSDAAGPDGRPGQALKFTTVGTHCRSAWKTVDLRIWSSPCRQKSRKMFETRRAARGV